MNNRMKEDIFGNALLQYWDGDKKSVHTIIREDGYKEVFNNSEYFKKTFTTNEKILNKFVYGKILDAGCGAGRCILCFQNRGFKITGADVSKNAVKVCRARDCKSVMKKDILKDDLGLNKYDTILLYGHNIGIAGKLKNVKPMLLNLKRSLKGGGRILINTLDVKETTNPDHLLYHKYKKQNGKYIGEIKIRIEANGEKSKWFYWLHLEPKKLIEIASECKMKSEIVGKSGSDYAIVLFKK